MRSRCGVIDGCARESRTDGCAIAAIAEQRLALASNGNVIVGLDGTTHASGTCGAGGTYRHERLSRHFSPALCGDIETEFGMILVQEDVNATGILIHELCRRTQLQEERKFMGFRPLYPVPVAPDHGLSCRIAGTAVPPPKRAVTAGNRGPGTGAAVEDSALMPSVRRPVGDRSDPQFAGCNLRVNHFVRAALFHDTEQPLAA
jgi:hypothetical protein